MGNCQLVEAMWVVSSSSFISEETGKTRKDFMLDLDQIIPKVQRYFFDENINLSLSSENIGAKPWTLKPNL